MFEIKRYTAEHKEEWNQFVAKSKNGTFLLDRDYMDYHADRFLDHSLMCYLDGELYALLPANEHAHTLYSHQGLTYGGLVTGSQAVVSGVMEVFQAINKYLKERGIHRVVYKAIPSIYHAYPAEEDLYALVQSCHARLYCREVSTAIRPSKPYKWRRDRHYNANKAETNGVVVQESDDLASFWKILDSNLMSRHQVHPVHSLSELQLLKARFPCNIRLYAAYAEGVMLGGSLLYVTPQVVHAQYISASSEGKKLHAVDAICRRLLQQEYCNAPFFDFGKSTEDEGRFLNLQLISQKEGFGGRAVCYDTYEWELT